LGALKGIMGVKQFNLDLRAAIQTADDFPCVSNLRKGDSDGELAFTYIYTHATDDEHEQKPIDIQALSTDPDSYPRHPGFLIFTSSDTPASLEKWLQEISLSTEGQSVKDVLTSISRALNVKLNLSDQQASQASLPESMDMSDYSAVDDDQDSYYDDDYDELDIDPLPPRRPAVQDPSPPTHAQTARLKRHLREARRAGFHVSIPVEEGGNVSFHLFSLSIRVSKLAIPDEALEAWGLEPSEYIVLLFRLKMGYPLLSDFLQLPCDQTTMQCKLGKCLSPEPSRESMEQMFEREPSGESDHNSKDGAKNDNPKSPFLPIYMSLSLDTLLNRTFPSLLRLRRSEGVSWDGAQELLFKLSRGNHLLENSKSSENVKVQQNRYTSAEYFGLEFLRQNYVSKDTDDLNVILIAMQFGLQRLVKCTKYCLVCHRRTEGGFEAVKPFVCENPLCLYQYLSLGFCQSIEHEIVNNPYVVDLLISFFYSAVAGHRLREFPPGLQLKCASSAFTLDSVEPIVAKACFESNVLKFRSTDYSNFRSIGEGQYVLLVVGKTKALTIPVMRECKSSNAYPVCYRSSTYQKANITQDIEKHICMIVSCNSTDFTFKVTSTHTSPANVTTNPGDIQNIQTIKPTQGGVEVMVFKYEQEIDKLEPAERDQALLLMTEGIPSVDAMRDYLTERPGRRLSSWKCMDSSTLSLLNWIVASNRSFIVQDASIPGTSPPDGETQEEKLVGGMSPGWMQFRFAQGSPEKEQIFVNHLKQVKEVKNGKHYPSLFAWHGSQLSNWHSIIRTGLDFSQTSNGRAYGDGVYFSKEFGVSCGYTNLGRSGFHSWPNSALRILNAISICEIVNEPTQFVSTNPHFVVNKIDWIQCRYLFVQTQQSSTELDKKINTGCSDFSIYLEQDPAHVLLSQNAPIGIPKSAIPISRRRALGQELPSATGSSINSPIVIDDTDQESNSNTLTSVELDHLLSSDSEDATSSVIGRKRRRTSTDSGLGETRLVPFQDGDVTPFQPGQVDVSSLPKLAEPTWAASSPAALRALNSQIKDLQKIQSSSSLATLGWYIDFEKLENLFHWIVELHSFDKSLPLAQDMIRHGCSSVVLELRFGTSFPISPPFVRVIRPRLLPFAQGGGGHVTVGGAICSELLTNSGWSPALSLEKVFLEVRMNLCEKDPPARLDDAGALTHTRPVGARNMDYNMFEAVDAFRRAATAHGWQIPSDLEMLQSMTAQ
jgi:ubiquitin-conjugating enzyme E2 Q